MPIPWPWPYLDITPRTVPWQYLQHDFTLIGWITRMLCPYTLLLQMLMNDQEWPYMIMLCYDQWPTARLYHDNDTIMTQFLYQQELVMTWSYDDYTMSMSQEEHDHGVMVISWSLRLTWLCLGMINHDHIITLRLAVAQPWDTQDMAEKCSWMITNDHLWICYDHWPM